MCLSAGGNHLLGAKLPAYMNATCRTRLLQCAAATIKDNTMSRGNQPSAGTVTLVGMDAHTRVLSLCVAEWRHGSDPEVKARFPNVMLEDMERVYERRIPRDAVTLVESSGNTRVIVRRLEAIGRSAVVLNSDILGSISEKDRVNDRIDAEKLAYAYARGNSSGKTVWIPSEEYAGYRDLISGYLRSSRDTTRTSNRIWAFCNSHGLPLPKRGMPRKAEKIRAVLEGMGLDANQRALVDGQLEDFEHFLGRRAEDIGRIKRIAIRRRDVLRLMQLPGIQLYVAFAIVAYVEDVRRFPTAKKLVSYFGLNPAVNDSGERERRNRRAGRSHGHLSRFGRSDVKHLCAEIGQAALRCDESPIGRWARRKLASGKEYNKVCMAAARKVITYAWYILNDVPSPNRDTQAFYERKLARAYGEVGRDEMTKHGFPTRASFVKAVSAEVFAHLPEPAPAADTASS